MLTCSARGERCRRDAGIQDIYAIGDAEKAAKDIPTIRQAVHALRTIICLRHVPAATPL